MVLFISLSQNQPSVEIRVFSYVGCKIGTSHLGIDRNRTQWNLKELQLGRVSSCERLLLGTYVLVVAQMDSA